MHKYRISVILLIALILAALTAKVLFVGKWIVPVLWGIVGVVIGRMWGTAKKDALRIGALYGAVISLAFLLFAKDWSIPITKAGSYMLFLAIGTAFGALCGGLASWVWGTRCFGRSRHNTKYLMAKKY